MPRVPPLALVRQFDTHRLIPSKHSIRGDSVLVRIADDDAHLQAIFELDAATNDRLLAERQLHRRCPVHFSPVAGELAPATLAEWILRDRLPVRLQLQLHKQLWGGARGV